MSLLIYGIQSGEFIKIGVTRSLRQRMEAMRLCNPHPMKVVTQWKTEDAYTVERKVHRALKEHAVGREWFRVELWRVRVAIDDALQAVAKERAEHRTYCRRRVAIRAARRGKMVASTPEQELAFQGILETIAKTNSSNWHEQFRPE